MVPCTPPFGTLLERLIWRVALAVGLLAGLSMFGFGLLALLPSDYAEVILIFAHGGRSAEPGGASPPFRCAAGLRRSDAGAVPCAGSARRSRAISASPSPPAIRWRREIGLRLAATAQLVGVAFLMMLGLGVPIGILAALHRGGPIDSDRHGHRGAGHVGAEFLGRRCSSSSCSRFVLGWAPSSGYGEWRHVVLPAAVIATASMGLTARYVRASLVSAFAEPHLRTALAKGRSRVGALLVHALPTALPGILTVLGLQLARMFDGAIVVETIFAWPGLGRMLVEALLDRDFPVLQAALLVVGAAYVTINLAVDLAVAAIDPRMGEAV